MKILSIYLKNYIGIFNGLGLNEISVDFKKSNNKIVVIRGKNGSGKSTLYKSIHPLPDSNDRLINGLEAEKRLEILDDNIVYSIIIIHGINKNRNRDTTKAYIKKHNLDGTYEELNPNGNVTSYRDILYNEFNLDPNFVALSQLSSEDRGLADKTPVERKKYVNSIIATLQAYNDMYKVLSKRSSIFKSMMNNLISKIDNIGEEDKLLMTLSSLENRITSMLNTKDSLIEELAANKSKISLIDPDGSIQISYDNIYQNLILINGSIKEVDDKCKLYINKLPEVIEFDDIRMRDFYNNIKNKISDIEFCINLEESEILRFLNERETEAENISKKNSKLLSLTSNMNFKDISKSIKECRSSIDEYNNIIQQMGIEDINNISKEEFIIGLNTLKEVNDIISTTKSFYTQDVIIKAIEHINNNSYPDIQCIEDTINNMNEYTTKLTIEHQHYITLKSIASKLDNRPNKCNIDNCQFIKDAIDANNQNPDDNILRIENELKSCTHILNKAISNKELYVKVIECINTIRSLVRNLEKNISIINKLYIGDVYINKDTILKAIEDNYTFTEIDTIYKYIDYANIIEDYKSKISLLRDLESQYKIYESKNEIIDELQSSIDSLNEKLNTLNGYIDNKKKSIFEYKKTLISLKDKLDICEILVEVFGKKKDLLNKKSEEVSKFNNIKNNMTIIKECIDNISNIESSISNISKTITPIINDRDKIKHGLVLLKEYKEELEVYKAKYSKVEIIKKYSSPSKGIQTLFMELYMNKTISLANELLSLLFEGEYVLGQFIINETEFRIPCIGSGIANDDISSMSTSQICMISMILSFVMLQQSSSKYNILKLDEIDGGLDTTNRLQFMNILEKQMTMLDTEQVFIISHNAEMDYSNCDIIQLKTVNNEIPDTGNIIYKY